MEPLDAATPLALACTGRRRPPRACCASSCSTRRAGAAVGQPADARAHGLQVLDERPYRIAPAGRTAGLDARLRHAGAGRRDGVDVDALHAALRGRVRADRRAARSRTTTSTGWSPRRSCRRREVVVLRAYAKYLRQVGFPLSQAYIEATLAAHPGIARLLVELVQRALRSGARPEGAGARRAGGARHRGGARRASRTSSRTACCAQYLALIEATMRTNFWRRDDAGRAARVPVVQVRPGQGAGPARAEADVRDLRLLAALRGRAPARRPGRARRAALVGPARGLPHRDPGPGEGADGEERGHRPGRLQGRLRAQARAVAGRPRGATWPRASPATRTTCAACSTSPTTASATAIVPPPEVQRHDADDPYLVVAADKGTATFSDFANAVSAEYGFWLGDAFASGGSVGYDHKEMGITARGAWEAVKRHFRELGVDIQTTDFTVVGIGDMSGDVFGNGMLLSRHIRLVAAFDHRHIFLDPDPDPAASFAERERLFRLPRSSWADYDAALISAGRRRLPAQRQVDPRSRRRCKAALGIDADALTPTELINAILKAPVDLLYNGGIGTYVKATRRDARRRRRPRQRRAARQRPRAALQGRRRGRQPRLHAARAHRVRAAPAAGSTPTPSTTRPASTAPTTRSTSRSCSGSPIADGELTEQAARRAARRDDRRRRRAGAARQLLPDAGARRSPARIAPQLLDAQQRFIRFLEKAGRLNRALEFLPDDDEIAARRRAGTGSPPRARGAARLRQDLAVRRAAGVDPARRPLGRARRSTATSRAALAERYAAEMARHPLKREIIATHVTNSMVNRVGSTFVHRLMETTGAAPHEVVRAFLLTREIFGFVPLWQRDRGARQPRRRRGAGASC